MTAFVHPVLHMIPHEVFDVMCKLPMIYESLCGRNIELARYDQVIPCYGTKESALANRLVSMTPP